MGESVAIIIFNATKDQVLMIKRRDIPVWVLPGGGIDPGESPEEAAVREGVEETGYQLKLVRKVAEYSPLNHLTKRTHYFELAITGGDAQTGDETKAIAFYPPESLPKAVPPFYRDWIKDALEGNPEVINKPIRGTSYLHLIKFLITHPILTIRFLLTKLGIHCNT